MIWSVRWLIALGSIALVVCLLIWARGHEHHHGTEVGSLATPARTLASG